MTSAAITSTPQWAQNKALELLREFQLKGLVGNDWTFGWNRRKNSVALCSYRKKQISLSIHYVSLSPKKEIEDSILHEICHILAGREAGHGPRWQAMCRLYGAKPKRCSDLTTDLVPAKYKGFCPVCNNKYYAHRRLKDFDKRICVARGCLAKKMKKFVIWEK